MIKLFIELANYEWFHYGDKPERKLMKSDSSHYICPEGRRGINPLVAVFTDVMKTETPRKSIYNHTKGDHND